MFQRLVNWLRLYQSFVIVFVSALLIRVAWLLISPHNITSDEVEYHGLAAKIAAGESYGLPFWPPGYTLTLAFLYRLFIAEPIVAFIFNLVISLATIVVLALLAWELFGSRLIALISALIMSIMPSYILPITLVRYEIWLQFCLILSLYLAFKSPRWYWYVAIGLLSGMATLMRPLMIFWPLLIYLIAFVHQRRSLFSGAFIKVVFWAQLCTAIVLLPWMLYASNVTGRFVPVALNGGINLWIGNNPKATGAYFDPPGEFWAPENEPVARAEALAYMRENPGAVLRLLPTKIYYSINRDYWVVDWIFLDYDAERVIFSRDFLTKFSEAFYIAVCLLALYSILDLLHKRSYRLLLSWLLLAYSIAGQLPFFGSPRFRWITQFVLIYFAALTIARLLEWYQLMVNKRAPGSTKAA